jgi:maltokinase
VVDVPGLSAAWPPGDPVADGYRRGSLAGSRLIAATALPGGPGPARALAMAVAAGSGDTGSGFLLVPLVADPAASGGWRRAVAGDGVAAAVVALLRTPGREQAGVDRLDGGFALDRAGTSPDAAPPIERPMGVDQTNESVVVGERTVVKWLLQPDAARERAPRLLRHLGAAGFDEVPRLAGSLVWRAGPGAPPLTVALVDRYLPGSRDGWEWCTDGVLAHVAAGHRCGDGCPGAFAAGLGRLTARLHAALATTTAVITEPVGTAGRETVSGWARAAASTLTDALALTAADDPEAGAELARVVSALSDRIGRLAEMGETRVQPVHGDLHVGQVLRGPHGLAIIDFDGNPAVDGAAVLAPAPAARDVAGMLCSLDHVGRVAIGRGGAAAKVEPWIEDACAAFLDAYRDTLAVRGRPELFDERLLVPFRVEQECRELVYAARFLPRWRYAPMGAIRAIVAR